MFSSEWPPKRTAQREVQAVTASSQDGRGTEAGRLAGTLTVIGKGVEIRCGVIGREEKSRKFW